MTESVPLAYEVLSESTRTVDGWTHDACGSDLLSVRINHSVHDGPGLSGHGEVRTEVMPYCPTCHERPSSHGAPVHPRDTEWPKVRLRPLHREGLL